MSAPATRESSGASAPILDDQAWNARAVLIDFVKEASRAQTFEHP